MTELEKYTWNSGYRSAWIIMLSECVHQLGYDTPEATAKSWIIEREEAIMRLRQLCAAIGDNDWPDDLQLSDVIEKHLLRYVEK